MDFKQILADIRTNYGIQRTGVPDSWTLPWAVDTYRQVGDAMLHWKGRPYDIGSMRPYVEALMGWTILDAGCRLDMTKGILFKGATGKGKTFALEVWQKWLGCVSLSYKSDGNLLPMKLTMAAARTIAAEYSQDAGVLNRYASLPLLCIDDIGAEGREQNNYGNRINVVNEILTKRQERHLLTFGTTNYNELTAEAGYDDRLKRRINALFNVISIKHTNQY